MLGDERINDGARLQMCRMAVIRGQCLASLEIADEREIDRAPARREAAADFNARKPRDTAALRLQDGPNLIEAFACLGLQPPENDVPDHVRVKLPHW